MDDVKAELLMARQSAEYLRESVMSLPTRQEDTIRELVRMVDNLYRIAAGLTRELERQDHT